MYGDRIKITKDFILSHITEDEIFERYIGIVPNFTDFFVNPLRHDDDLPGCRFYRDSRGVLKFNDFAANLNLDCFNIVQLLHIDKNTGNNVNFYQALEIIAKDFKLSNLTYDYTKRKINSDNLSKTKKQLKPIIKIQKLKNWTNTDIKYWTSFFLEGKDMKFFNVVPVNKYWFYYYDENKKLVYKYQFPYIYSEKDPCYCYLFKDGGKKLYFPFRNKNAGLPRFIQDTAYLQGYSQLPREGSDLVITKSYKDVMCLRKIAKLPSVAPSSETNLISHEQFSDLYNRFDNIYTLFDWDRAGIIGSNKYKREYETNYIFFTDGSRNTINYGSKDFAAFLKKNGIKETLKLVDYVRQYYL